MGFTIETLKGNLLAVDLFSPTDAQEAGRLTKNLAHSLKMRGGRCVLVTDLRGLKRLEPETIEAYRRVLVHDNQLIIRAGLIAPASADAMQFYRTVKESDNANRQIFTKQENLEEWVSPLLTDDQRTALQQFLSKRAMSAAASTGT